MIHRTGRLSTTVEIILYYLTIGTTMTRQNLQQ